MGHDSTGTFDSSYGLARMERALFRMLKALVFRADPNSPLVELPLSQFKCLRAIGEQQGQKMNDIAHRLEIKLPATSQIVDRLVRRGMVERRADPDDRRVVRLHLSESAQGILADFDAARKARMAATAARLDQRAMRKVIDGLELLADASESVAAKKRETMSPAHEDSDPLVELMTRQTRRQAVRGDVSPAAAGSVINRGGG